MVEHLITKIGESYSMLELFGTADWKRAYRRAVFQLHPDRCSHAGAASALVRLNELRYTAEHGRALKDDAGALTAFDTEVRFAGGYGLLVRSYENYQKLRVLRNGAAKHFQQMIPERLSLDRELVATWQERAVPLTGRQLPLHHVNWILSRLLEFCAWLAQEGYVHGGLHPSSVWVVPKTHGILIPSFYHLSRRGATVKTISAAYQHWYPTELFTKKRAVSAIDLEMAKRLAAYLLGDPSGSGVVLRREMPGPVTDFLLTYHDDAFTCYDDYRRLLKQHFKRKFYPLAV